MSAGIWDLHDEATALDAAALAWATAPREFDDSADTFITAAKDALSEWEGQAAEAFDAQRSDLIEDLDLATSLAGKAATALQSAAGAVRSAQGELDGAWASIMTIPHTYDPFGWMNFQTSTPEEQQRVLDAKAAAAATRAALDAELERYRTTLFQVTQEWQLIAARWRSSSTGETPFIPLLPPEGDATGIVLHDGRAVVSAGAGDNEIRVTIDPETGDTLVTIDGATYRIPAGTDVTIRGGNGNDIIELPADTDLGFTVVGGAGLDRITGGGGDDQIFASIGDDEVEAGGGNDYVSGGAGHDYIDGQAGADRLFGGTGTDTLYGLDGADRLSGETDSDYVEGGAGDDVILGGRGNDVLSGGRDDDEIYGGVGDDVSYGGLGTDKTIGGDGRDSSHDDRRVWGSDNEVNVNIEIPDTTEHIRIEGSPEFIARVQADLDMLRSSPTGQQLLADLEENYRNSGGLFGWGKQSLIIREWSPPADKPYAQNSTAQNANPDVVEYLPSIDNFRGAPPVVVLQHELSHVYDYTSGTYDGDPYQGGDTTDNDPARDPIKIAERQASGLPIDHDNDPSTPEILDPDRAAYASENALREEMNLPKREHYR